MVRKVLIGCVAAGAVALNAPMAHAEPVLAQCRFNTIAADEVTGGQNTFTGVAEGVVVASAPGNEVSISCVVKVNGGAAASTPAQTGNTVAATAGQVTYTAQDGDTRELCAAGIDGGTPYESCFPVTTQQVPPQEVIDLLVLVTSIPDPLLCPVLAGRSPGVPGAVDITAEGDVILPDPVGKLWDCPPYDPSA